MKGAESIASESASSHIVLFEVPHSSQTRLLEPEHSDRIFLYNNSFIYISEIFI